VLADSSLLEINGTFLVEVLAFLLMLAVMAKWVFPPVMAAAEARQNQIEETLKTAERTRDETTTALAEAKQELDAARLQAREVIDRAKRETAIEVDELRRKTQLDAQEQLQRAREEITAERDRVMQDLRREVGALVVAAAGHVLGESIDAAAHQRLIDESLAKVTATEGNHN